MITIYWAINRRQGKWEACIEGLKEAVAIDPRNPVSTYNLATTYTVIRRYQEADKWYDRALSLSPDYTSPILLKYGNHMLWKGNAEHLRSSLQTISRSSGVNLTLHRFNVLEGGLRLCWIWNGAWWRPGR